MPKQNVITFAPVVDLIIDGRKLPKGEPVMTVILVDGMPIDRAIPGVVSGVLRPMTDDELSAVDAPILKLAGEMAAPGANDTEKED